MNEQEIDEYCDRKLELIEDGCIFTSEQLRGMYEFHKKNWNEYYDGEHEIQETFGEWVNRMNDQDRLVILWRFGS